MHQPFKSHFFDVLIWNRQWLKMSNILIVWVWKPRRLIGSGSTLIFWGQPSKFLPIFPTPPNLPWDPTVGPYPVTTAGTQFPQQPGSSRVGSSSCQDLARIGGAGALGSSGTWQIGSQPQIHTVRWLWLLKVWLTQVFCLKMIFPDV